MYSSQFPILSAENLTEKSPPASTGPAVGGGNSIGVRTEEGQSSGFFSRLADGAAGLYHSAGNAVSGAAHTVGGVASSTYHSAVNLANFASGYVQRAEHGVTRGLHAAEDWVDQGSHALAGHVADVPGLGFVARGLADQATMTAQLAGGMVGGATTMVGGIFNAALHPIDTMAGVEAMVEHTPMPLGKMARGAHDLIDVARGRQTVSGMINRAVNPLATMQEDEEFWGRMGSAVIDPYRQSIKEGRYGEAVGRGVFDIGSMLLGVGEIGEAGRGAGVAGDVARATNVAEATRAAGTAGEATRALGTTAEATRGAIVAGDAGRIAEVADTGRMRKAISSGARSVEETGSSTKAARTAAPPGRNTQPLTHAELETAREHALRLGMPEEKIQVHMGRAKETSWGQVFGEERLIITEDVKAAPLRVPAPGQGKSLSANQRVSIKGAMSHEVVGHREADLAGHSKTKSYSHYADLPPEQKAAEWQIDRAKDEAQASLRAAKFSPGLSNAERKILFKDAMERLAQIGLSVDDVPGLNLFLGRR